MKLFAEEREEFHLVGTAYVYMQECFVLVEEERDQMGFPLYCSTLGQVEEGQRWGDRHTLPPHFCKQEQNYFVHRCFSFFSLHSGNE